MKNAYPLNSLSDFTQKETEELTDMGLRHKLDSPSEMTIQRILGFSKQLSVRPSKSLGQYVQNLN